MKKFFVFLFVITITFSNKVCAFNISASSAVLINEETKAVIYEKNAYKKMPMASTTKIMTAICAIENMNTNIPIKVDDKAIGIEGSSIYLEKLSHL